MICNKALCQVNLWEKGFLDFLSVFSWNFNETWILNIFQTLCSFFLHPKRSKKNQRKTWLLLNLEIVFFFRIKTENLCENLSVRDVISEWRWFHLLYESYNLVQFSIRFSLAGNNSCLGKKKYYVSCLLRISGGDWLFILWRFAIIS